MIRLRLDDFRTQRIIVHAAIIAFSLACVVAANAGPRVTSKSGISVRVAASARASLQCVVDYVEAAGVKIVSMRGVGPGTVRHSLHPSGRAIDINQLARNVTRPRVPRAVSLAAARHCGVVSGARWRHADNGHWNLAVRHAHRQRDTPRSQLASVHDPAAIPPYPIP